MLSVRLGEFLKGFFFREDGIMRVFSCFGATFGAWLMGLTIFSASGVMAGEPAETDILSAKGHWRYFIVMRDAVVGTAKEAKPIAAKYGYTYNTEAPPTNWAAPDFDDSEWGRRPGPFFPGYGFQQQDTLGVLYLRGSFEVTDPEKAPELNFSAVYRGGMAVYINDQELTRSHLPEGALTADTLAEDYPTDCWLNPEGKVIRWGWGDPGKYQDRCEMRIRRMEGVKIPKNLLRKGVNVLALAVHRSAASQEWRQAKDWWNGTWNTAGLHDLKLSAPAATEAVKPNIARPQEVRIWNANPMAPVSDKDFADPTMPLRSIRIVGARGGFFSGQALVGGETPIKGIKAEI
jgi:hypothetical protein